MALRLTGTVQVAAVTGTPILNKLERSRDSGTQGHGPNRCAAGSTPSLPGPGSDKEPQCIESSEPPLLDLKLTAWPGQPGRLIAVNVGT